MRKFASDMRKFLRYFYLCKLSFPPARRCWRKAGTRSSVPGDNKGDPILLLTFIFYLDAAAPDMYCVKNDKQTAYRRQNSPSSLKRRNSLDRASEPASRLEQVWWLLPNVVTMFWVLRYSDFYSDTQVCRQISSSRIGSSYISSDDAIQEVIRIPTLSLQLTGLDVPSSGVYAPLPVGWVPALWSP